MTNYIQQLLALRDYLASSSAREIYAARYDDDGEPYRRRDMDAVRCAYEHFSLMDFDGIFAAFTTWETQK